MKKHILTGLITIFFLANGAWAVLMDFNSVSIGNNAAKMNEWYNAIGITQAQHLIDFENITVGTNMEDNAALFSNLVISVSSGGAFIRSSASYFGGSDPGVPGSTRALALTDNQILTLTFATPIDYISFFDIDISDSAHGTVLFADDTTASFEEGNEAGYNTGNSATFYGLYSTDKKIKSITFTDTGGDDVYGLDDIRYGIIPEPATLTILIMGAFLISGKRRR